MFCLGLLALVCGPSLPGLAQPYDTPRRCVEYIQDARQAVHPLWRADRPKPEELAKAVARYRELVTYLDDPRVRKLFPDDLELRLKRQDLLGDLVAMHARAGDVKSMNQCLDEMSAFFRGQTKGEGNPGFWVWMWGRDAVVPAVAGKNPEVAERIERIRVMDPHWGLFKASALATPYRDTLPLEERLAGVAHLWAEVKYNFAYFDRVRFDWNQKLLEYLPLAAKAEDTWEYYRVLRRMCAELGDAHTNVYVPHELWKKWRSGRPPVSTRRVVRTVIVDAVLSPSLADIKVGDEVLEIDGQPVAEYAEREVAPYASCSTPQDKDVRVYGYELLLGPPDKSVILTLRRGDKPVTKVPVARSGYKDIPPDKAYDFVRLPNGIGVARLNGFESAGPARGLRADLKKHPDLTGLVLDVRRNEGGDSDVAEAIVAGLIDKAVTMHPSTARAYNPADRAWNKSQLFTELGPWEIRPAKERWFGGPVAVLTGPRTFSAGEDFVAMIRSSKRGLVFGEPTGGSTGQPLSFPLPGGGRGRVCTKRDVLADGTPFVGVGIKPDVPVQVTSEDLRTGRDHALDAAVESLLKSRR